MYFVNEFKNYSGLDLQGYKSDQVKRRLETYMRQLNIKGFNDLVFEMKKNPSLVESVKKHITINVTEFIRNVGTWDVFYKKVVPEVLHKNKTNHIKIWSAACSSGEEPYTIAMLMDHHFPHIQTEIIATDLNPDMITKAKKGEYLTNGLKNINSELTKKYFVKKDDKNAEVSKHLKKKITFKTSNLLTDSYPSALDIIVCRNVLIYFNEDTQHSIYEKFNRSLKNDGFLFIGSTEHIHQPGRFGFIPYESFYYRKNRKQ